MNAHISRNSKWKWANGNETYSTDVLADIVAPDHAVFAGVEIDPNGQAMLLTDEYNVNVIGVADAGNGSLLAARASDGSVAIATWEAGVEFYEGAGQIAGGARMFFAAGSGSKSPKDGLYNLTADGEVAFLNAVTYMLNKNKQIVWVSFHGADDVPSADAADAGFTEAPDKGYTDLLKGAGYSVTRFITTSTPDVAVLEAADLVITSRSVNSGDYSNDGATTWNGVRAPMIITGGYPLRSSRMGFTTGTDMPDTTGDIQLVVSDPNHPIFAGIALTDGVMDNPFAGVVVYPTDGTTLARGISINNSPVDDEGTVLAMIAAPADANTPANGPIGGMVIGEWPAGAVLEHSGGAGADVLAGPRLVFLTGSRETSGIDSETAGLYDLYEDGAQMFLNAVAYMLPAPGADALVASYALDGDVSDSSGNMLDGIIAGDPIFVEGQSGLALQLDGIDDYVEFGTSPLFDMTEQVTLSAWVKPNDIGNSQDNPWVGKGDKSYALKGFRTGTVVEFFVYDGGWYTCHADVGEAFNGEWHHAAGSYDGAQLKVYIDGEPAAVADYVGGIALSASSVNIGKNSDKADRFYEGAIDDVTIYNRALTKDEIFMLFLAGE